MHFLHTDIQKFKGRLKLKPDAIPVYFNCKDDEFFPESDIINASQNIENGQCFNEQNICKKCDVLSSELDELKNKLFKTKVDSDVELTRKNIRINELKGKCDDQALIINSLKQQVSTLGKYLTDSENEIKNVQLQMGRVPETEVNVYICP